MPKKCLPVFAFLALLITNSPAADQPNVVVFLVDDMGLMDTSVPMLTDREGQPERHPLNDFYRTPSMERLARHGVRINPFYAMSVCSPSRVSLMTGKTSARHHTTQWIKPEANNAGPFGPPDWGWKGIRENTVTLPMLLRDAGYRTIHCGKAHFGPNDSFGELPENFGFDVNIAGCAYGAPASYYGTKHFGHAMKRRRNRAVPGLEKYHGQEIYLTEALTLEMNAAIKKAVGDQKPFFAYMAHYAVHSPFEPDPRFTKNYPGVSGHKLAYATMIEGIDKSLGDMLDQLETLGKAEETLVFFTGDNGSDAPLGGLHDVASSAPIRGKKGTHYEGGMRVPFIAAWAKANPEHPMQKKYPIAAGSIQPSMSVIYDLFPTILHAAGVAYEGKIDGRDLAPVLAGKKTDTSSGKFFMHFPHAHRSSYFSVLRRGDWKLIYHYRKPPESQVELFNLKEDPYESANLAISHPEKRSMMIKALIEELEQTGAQLVLSEDKQSHLKPKN